MKLPEEMELPLATANRWAAYEALVRDCADKAAEIAAEREATKVTQDVIRDGILSRYGLEPK